MSVLEKCLKCIDNLTVDQIFKNLVRKDLYSNYYVPLKINICDNSDTLQNCGTDFTTEQLFKSLIVVDDCSHCAINISIDSESIDTICEVCGLYQNDSIYYKYSSDFIIDSQRDNMSVGWKDGYFYFSEDNSLTFTKGAAYGATSSIGFCYIFANGNVLFAIPNAIYLSTDKLQSYTEITVLDTLGNPISVAASGDYFRQLQPDNPVIIDEVEHLVWGNYTNLGINSEVNIYHTYDNGETVTMVYQFGQNPTYGSLGDALNPVICRHVHAITYNHNDNFWWLQTGDSVDECHWMKGLWDGTDWTWSVEYTGDTNSWYKTTGFFFDESNDAYWGSDSSAAAKKGVFKVPFVDIGNEGEYVRKYISTLPSVSFIMNNDGEMITTPFSFNSQPTQLVISKDFGENNVLISESELTHLPENQCLYRVWPKNNEGYYLMKVGFASSYWGSKASLMVKIK